MNQISKFLEYLIENEIKPLEEVIKDGLPHTLTDTKSGKQFKYIIYDKNFKLFELTNGGQS